MGEQELKIKFEHRFNHGRKTFTMRHYNDGTWELLDEDGLPVVQCSDDDEGVIDTTE
ncbi:MAG: hypothetical protein UT24_C0003G0047 [Candidatus Woesebacteria bacterium GW2011_GWB1_39_12]|uniref:Uncharacterized protein n=1 Tax=Candidatus Woesebacteria bacterium GW2011_GWB1_39_12 TaxID=1618574 RepID=A0A0G0PTY2_9BACT|nr:MAG: hypothetical protein UT24_C0003G0047 [Candidatus Woesebacteria bacterium GW2011_GWB1_39_12]